MGGTNCFKIGKFCAGILVLMIMAGCASMNLGADAQTDCLRKISTVQIKCIGLPVLTKLDKFMITPDSKKIIVLLPAFKGDIYREQQQWYRFPRKAIRKEEASFLRNQWSEQAKENPGWEISKYGEITASYEYFIATQKIFYALDINSGKWEELKWKEGEDFFKENKAQGVQGVSPDGSMVIKKTVSQTKLRHIFFMMTDSPIQKYRLVLSSLQSGQEKTLFEGWELEGEPLVVQWSPDSTAAIILYNNIDFEGKGFIIVRITR